MAAYLVAWIMTAPGAFAFDNSRISPRQPSRRRPKVVQGGRPVGACRSGLGWRKWVASLQNLAIGGASRGAHTLATGRHCLSKEVSQENQETIRDDVHHGGSYKHGYDDNDGEPNEEEGAHDGRY